MMLVSHFYDIAITLRPQVPLLQYCYYITTTSATFTVLLLHYNHKHQSYTAASATYDLGFSYGGVSFIIDRFYIALFSAFEQTH